ncbi:uncharacterized protein SCHCODRAFT_02361211 [Schizophyllum commune H4-8]|nr:uncharacterized protein SCHCODRAFT_02361211 [Schizophyllum commune H4-8]KAI5889176.1 hypothetical protein SCHCODRAFT_02361211 [Schizophyllum commune H4-8]
MPLFKSSHPEPQPASPTGRKGSMFSRNRSASPVRSHNTSTSNGHSSGGLFSSHRRSTSSDRSSASVSRSRSTGGGLFSSNRGSDPTIASARRKVADAETAERDADRALMQARQAVKDARDHVKFLEQEAAEDARRAKAKQAEAKVINKSAKHLGRHGH